MADEEQAPEVQESKVWTPEEEQELADKIVATRDGLNELFRLAATAQLLVGAKVRISEGSAAQPATMILDVEILRKLG